MDALLDMCNASVYILLKVVEVMWSVDLYKYNVNRIGWCMLSVMCYDCFKKRVLCSIFILLSDFLYK
jgi:hypothetical protein